MNFPADERKTDPAGPSVMVGWTTTEHRAQAESLGRGLVEHGLVACAQISGPITSIYRWEGAVQAAEEYRLILKFAAPREAEIEAWVHAHHPYAIPQWVCVAADGVSKNYLNWVMQTSS